MMKLLVLLSSITLLAVSVWAQDYKLEPVSTPAPDLPAAYASVIQKSGYRVVGRDGAWCEVWFRNSISTGSKPEDPSISFPIAQGALLGVIRFPNAGADRRGQTIKAGLYTMRYSVYPVDGAHQGVAPQRDFALLTPVSGDADPNATPAFAALVAMSNKASGTPHPAVLSLETPAGSEFPSVSQEGEHDWVLSAKIGDVSLSIIVIGKHEG
jgi:hypothetical protein